MGGTVKEWERGRGLNTVHWVKKEGDGLAQEVVHE